MIGIGDFPPTATTVTLGGGSTYGSPMVQYGSVWFSMVPVVPCGSVWFRVAPCGSVWFRTVPYGPVWFRVIPYDSLWLTDAYIYLRDFTKTCNLMCSLTDADIYLRDFTKNLQLNVFVYRCLHPLT